MTRADGAKTTTWHAKLTRAERDEYLTALRRCVAMRELLREMGR